MREKEIKALSEPYAIQERGEVDRRFNSAIGADVPSAAQLTREILHDLDESSFGVSWWKSLNVEERILISDYLYQCSNSIEINLGEAQLHYFEWLDVRDRHNNHIVDALFRDSGGELRYKLPPSRRPLDDLPSKLEALHVCGFFRAIGSSLDCLGAVMIGVLGLSVPLRRSDINKAEKALPTIITSSTSGSKIQADFRDYFEQVKAASGVEGWLEWADQYRNMFVHRGRRTTYNRIIPKDPPLLDANGQWIPRASTKLYLAKFPDRSEIEAFIKSKNIFLEEDAEITFKGIFKSCQELLENICERLLSIWKERRNNPNLIEQPARQWETVPKPCNFTGYIPDPDPFDPDLEIGSETMFHRKRSASVDNNARRSLWANSKWDQ